MYKKFKRTGKKCLKQSKIKYSLTQDTAWKCVVLKSLGSIIIYIYIWMIRKVFVHPVLMEHKVWSVMLWMSSMLSLDSSLVCVTHIRWMCVICLTENHHKPPEWKSALNQHTKYITIPSTHKQQFTLTSVSQRQHAVIIYRTRFPLTYIRQETQVT